MPATKELTREQEKQLNILFSKGLVKRSATPSHGNKKRGVGITRAMKSKSKKNLRIEKNSRKINRRK